MVFGYMNIQKTISITIDNIKQVNCIEFLGVYNDCKRTWSEDVNSVRTKMAKNLIVMQLNGNFMDLFCTLYIVHGFYHTICTLYIVN